MEGQDTEENHSIEESKKTGPGEYDIVVELSTSNRYNSREEAIQHARKIRSELESDSAVDHLDVGRIGVLRSD